MISWEAGSTKGLYSPAFKQTWPQRLILSSNLASFPICRSKLPIQAPSAPEWIRRKCMKQPCPCSLLLPPLGAVSYTNANVSRPSCPWIHRRSINRAMINQSCCKSTSPHPSVGAHSHFCMAEPKRPSICRSRAVRRICSRVQFGGICRPAIRNMLCQGPSFSLQLSDPSFQYAMGPDKVLDLELESPGSDR
jgi:hypothetical protein